MGIFYSKVVKDNSCLICEESIEHIFHFKFPRCNHIICAECLCRYLEVFSTAKILCPFQECEEVIPDNIVRKCLTFAQQEIYDTYCLPSIAKKCLIANCSGSIASELNEGHFNCSVCQQPNCLTCQNLHREDELCGTSLNKEQYEKEGSTNLLQLRRSQLIQLRKDSNLIRNPEKSNCNNCLRFLLPRDGIVIMPCLHNFCQECLQEYLNTQEILAGLTCLACEVPLEHRECKELIGDEKLDTLCLKAVTFHFYHCKTPDCTAFWDAGDFKEQYKCKKCNKLNCISCRAVHEGLTCYEYQQTEHYRTRLADEQFEREKNPITCFNCNNKFIRAGGCGAMKCNNCLKQVCAFSGKELGPKGCMCKRSKRCHKDCNIGCIPEGKSKYELELKKYYYDS